MILSPNFILKEGILEPASGFPLSEKQIQPNGTDLRIREIHELSGRFVLYETEEGKEEKILPEQKKILPNSDGFFELKVGIPYGASCYEYVRIPKGVVAIVYGRSSLNRNGILIRAGLYDSGFNNVVGFTIYPWLNCSLRQNTRVAQIIFLEADSSGLYSGQYQDKG